MNFSQIIRSTTGEITSEDLFSDIVFEETVAVTSTVNVTTTIIEPLLTSPPSSSLFSTVYGSGANFNYEVLSRESLSNKTSCGSGSSGGGKLFNRRERGNRRVKESTYMTQVGRSLEKEKQKLFTATSTTAVVARDYTSVVTATTTTPSVLTASQMMRNANNNNTSAVVAVSTSVAAATAAAVVSASVVSTAALLDSGGDGGGGGGSDENDGGGSGSNIQNTTSPLLVGEQSNNIITTSLLDIQQKFKQHYFLWCFYDVNFVWEKVLVQLGYLMDVNPVINTSVKITLSDDSRTLVRGNNPFNIEFMIYDIFGLISAYGFNIVRGIFKVPNLDDFVLQMSQIFYVADRDSLLTFYCLIRFFCYALPLRSEALVACVFVFITSGFVKQKLAYYRSLNCECSKQQQQQQPTFVDELRGDSFNNVKVIFRCCCTPVTEYQKNLLANFCHFFREYYVRFALKPMDMLNKQGLLLDANILFNDFF